MVQEEGLVGVPDEATVERRLAAILAADVVGYSRLMGVDEVGTLRALKAIRRELADPAIAAHHGRVVKTTGDGTLIEFGGARALSQAFKARRHVDTTRRGHFLSLTPRSPSMNSTPALFNASWIASRSAGLIHAPVSKSAMTVAGTTAATARSASDMSRRARAARHWVGVMRRSPPHWPIRPEGGHDGQRAWPASRRR